MEGPMPGRSSASCPLSKECSLGLPAWLFLQPGQLVETLSSHGALRPSSCPSLCLLYVTPSGTPSMGTQLRSRHTRQPPAPETFKDPTFPCAVLPSAPQANCYSFFKSQDKLHVCKVSPDAPWDMFLLRELSLHSAS